MRRFPISLFLLGAIPGAAVSIVGFYLATQAHELGTNCVSLQACPASLQASIAQLSNEAAGTALLALALFVSTVYIAFRLSNGIRGRREWEGKSSPAQLVRIVESVATSSPPEGNRDQLSLLASNLGKRVEVQVYEFEGLSTRSAVVLGFVSVTLAAGSATIFTNVSQAGPWFYASTVTLLASAALLLACIVAGWGHHEFPLDELTLALHAEESQLYAAKAKSLIYLASENNASLAWVRGFFYTGTSVWGIGLLLVALAWLLH